MPRRNAGFGCEVELAQAPADSPFTQELADRGRRGIEHRCHGTEGRAPEPLPPRESTRRAREPNIVAMTTFTNSRPSVSKGALAEYDAFADLIESLNDSEWDAPSRCSGWQVRDVAGHVTGLAEDTAAGVPGSRNGDEEAASTRHESPAGMAARLRTAVATLRALVESLDDAAWAGPSGLPDLTLGEGVLTLWFDTYVHADDIRTAVGRPVDRGSGLEASVAYLAPEIAKKGWGPATLALDGIGRYDIKGGGREITGDPHQFVLVATGRADASTMGLDPEVSIY
jgi:uncharacterized protein (TIGR03083 family)